MTHPRPLHHHIEWDTSGPPHHQWASGPYFYHRILFVGRTQLIPDGNGFHAQTKEQVLSSLCQVEAEFDIVPLHVRPYRYVVEHALSHLPFPTRGGPRRYFKILLTEIQGTGEDLLIVFNGWDGLTNDTQAFYGLFGSKSVHVTCSVYASDPPTEQNVGAEFHEADVFQMCVLFQGHFNELQLDPSTRRVVWYFRAWPRMEIELTKAWPHMIYGKDRLHHTLPLITIPPAAESSNRANRANP